MQPNHDCLVVGPSNWKCKPMRRSASDLNAASLVDLSEFRFAVLVRMAPAAGSLNSRITPSIEMISPLFVRWDAVVLRVIVLDKDCLVKVLLHLAFSRVASQFGAAIDEDHRLEGNRFVPEQCGTFRSRFVGS